MEISLKDQVVILYEAHNMEDTARESAGEKIGDDALQKAIDELDKMSEKFLCVREFISYAHVSKKNDEYYNVKHIL